MFTFTRFAAVALCAALTVTTTAQSTGKMSIRPAKKSNTAAKQEVPPAKATTMEHIADALRAARISAERVNNVLSDADLQLINEEAQFFGGVSAEILKVDFGTGAVIVWKFDDPHALEVNLHVHDKALQFGDFLIVPTQVTDSTWAKISNRLSTVGAIPAKPTTAAPALVRSQLQTIRGQLELYLIQNGSYPPFARSGWKTLIAEDYLHEPPANPLSTSRDQASIALVHQPGLDGTAVTPDVAGWVWNTADKKLYPAGYSEKQLGDMTDNAGYWRNEIDDIRWRAARNGADWMKLEIVEQNVAIMRAAVKHSAMMIDLKKMTGEWDGESDFPTLEELRDEIAPSRSIRPNPFNGSEKIQAATWNAHNPPVSGDAGWNYDETTGTIWANTRVADAHKQ